VVSSNIGLRYDKILLTEYAKLTARKSSKASSKTNLPNLFWLRNPPTASKKFKQDVGIWNTGFLSQRFGKERPEKVLRAICSSGF
jgi:hypothetical protein